MRSPEQPSALALQGLRVVDLSTAVAMPYAATIMADLGAEVVKIESHHRMDDRVWGALQTAIFPENETGELYWEESANHHTLHRNKASVTLDLKLAEGLELFEQLVGVADVLIENNRPGVFERLGLSYDGLRAQNPRLVILSNTGFGRSGPWKQYPGVASMMEPLTGLAFASGYEDGDPERIGQAYIDYLCAWNGVAAVLSALHHRRRTGNGQHIDQSMFQVGMHTVVEPLLENQLQGTITSRMGNSHRWMAPHAAYPCKGDDRWIVICVRSDAEWSELRNVLGADDGLSDERFADTIGRHRHRAEVDQAVAKRTVQWEPFALMHELQGRKVPAGVVQTARDLFDDPQLRDRGYWHVVDHPAAPRVGRRPLMGMPFTLSETPPTVRRPAPSLGQDNARVLGEWLAIEGDRLEALEAASVIAARPARAPDRGKPDTLPLDEQQELGMIRDYDLDYRDRAENGAPASRRSYEASRDN
jgi:crotonobetainyl-CoA:carnitine CoA-transferase CaiB-like acyl-CoA transferase